MSERIRYIMYHNTVGTTEIHAGGDIMVCISVAAPESYKMRVCETHTSLACG